MNDDTRLYLLEPGWQPALRFGDERFYCNFVREGENHYHLIANAELYLRKATEICCLDCARRRGIVTTQRPILGQTRKPDET